MTTLDDDNLQWKTTINERLKTIFDRKNAGHNVAIVREPKFQSCIWQIVYGKWLHLLQKKSGLLVPYPNPLIHVKLCTSRLSIKISSFLYVCTCEMLCILYLSFGILSPVLSPHFQFNISFIFIFEVVFIFYVVFIFQVIFIFQVVFIFEILFIFLVVFINPMCPIWLEAKIWGP